MDRWKDSVHLDEFCGSSNSRLGLDTVCNSWYIQTQSAIVPSVPRFFILHSSSALLCKTCQKYPLYPSFPSMKQPTKSIPSYKKIFFKTPTPTFNILNFENTHPIIAPPPYHSPTPLNNPPPNHLQHASRHLTREFPGYARGRRVYHHRVRGSGLARTDIHAYFPTH